MVLTPATFNGFGVTIMFTISHGITGSAIGKAHATQTKAEQAAIRQAATVSLDIFETDETGKRLRLVSFVAAGTVCSATGWEG